jgi:hypothetical protein
MRPLAGSAMTGLRLRLVRHEDYQELVISCDGMWLVNMDVSLLQSEHAGTSLVIPRNAPTGMRCRKFNTIILCAGVSWRTSFSWPSRAKAFIRS